ncbi:MAG TPA: ketol-acid reductoisomerase [candidate division Zixibacteria bacterium]|jgi:ketol-acid reductoisomerase
MRVIRTAPLRPLKGKRIAVLGYGAQGRAQALNLRDAGFAPIVGLPPRSGSRRAARRDRLAVVTPRDAVRNTDIIFVLAPDHLHGRLFTYDIRPNLRTGQMLVFAHASSVHFGMVKPPKGVDVVLIAPLGPGKRLRELRGQRDGVGCFFAVYQNASRRARPIGLALARAVGCISAGAIETTFALEAVGDLFGEQAVLCGGLGALLQAGVETLVRTGHPPHAAYLECVYQIDLIVDLIKRDGLAGMYDAISPTAAYGAAVAGPEIISEGTRRAMRRLLREIESGRFFRQWVEKQSRRQRRPTVSKQFRRGEKTVLQQLGGP